MKVCEFCNSSVEDDSLLCPNCNGNKFLNKCQECGALYEGTKCEKCAERKKQQAEEERRKQSVASKIDSANSGLIWKTILTVFMPYIGGYFLITPYVKKSFKYFAIGWCIVCSFVFATYEFEQSAYGPLATVLTLIPVGVYLFRLKGFQGVDMKKFKKLTIGFVIIAVLAISCSLVGCGGSNSQSGNNSSAPAQEKLAEDSVVNDYVNSYNKISSSPMTELEKGNIRTKYFGNSYGYYVEMINSASTKKIVVTINETNDNAEAGTAGMKEVFVDTVRAIDSSISSEQANSLFNEMINGKQREYKISDSVLINYSPDVVLSSGPSRGYIEVNAL